MSEGASTRASKVWLNVRTERPGDVLEESSPAGALRPANEMILHRDQMTNVIGARAFQPRGERRGFESADLASAEEEEAFDG